MAQWTGEPLDEAQGMETDMGDVDSISHMTELSPCLTNTTSTTITTMDSGFFSYSSPSITTNDSNSYHGLCSGVRASASIAGRIAPPILENPRPDVYHAPDATPGQPYAFPDPENQWSLQTVQSLLSCWPEETDVASHRISERVGLIQVTV